MKKIPQRTCIGCNQTKNKKDLIRVVKNNEGKIFIDLKQVEANGRGGSDFRDIFKDMEKHLIGELPESIIVLTDGYIDYPKEKDSMGISILWIINNKESSPPFGKVIRLE